MDILELITATRSTRSFDESVPVPESVLDACAEAARLSASSRNDQVLRFRFVSRRDETQAVLAQTRWAGFLPDLELPPKGHHPTAFIVICHDTEIAPNAAAYQRDVGIAAQSVVLAASERGFASCMIGAFNAGEVARILALPESLKPQLVIALGKGDERIVLTGVTNGDTKYYRDAAGVHYVPKRSADDIVIKG